MLQVSVADQGVGIPQRDLHRVFDRFHRVEGEISKRVGGTGLGLAICQRLVEAHGGKIWVESRIGKGSTFYFHGSARQDGGTMNASKKTSVLVADDDPRLLKLVQRNLELNGYRVLTAMDGTNALKMAEAEELGPAAARHHDAGHGRPGCLPAGPRVLDGADHHADGARG